MEVGTAHPKNQTDICAPPKLAESWLGSDAPIRRHESTGHRQGNCFLSFLEDVWASMVEVFTLTWYILKMFTAFLLLLSLAVATALTLDAAARWRRRNREEGEGKSGIYAGRVWHARFKPTAHRFSYPIFYCLVDLDELDVAFPW